MFLMHMAWKRWSFVSLFIYLFNTLIRYIYFWCIWHEKDYLLSLFFYYLNVFIFFVNFDFWMSVICCPIIGVLCMAFYFFGYVLFFVVYFDFGLITYLVLIVSRFVPFSACLVAILLRASMRFSRQKYQIDAEVSK